MLQKDTGQKRGKCPYESANWLSRILFWWLIPIFRTGFRRRLCVDDIPEVSSDQDCTNLADVIIRCRDHTSSDGRQKRSLVSALLNTFAWKLAVVGFLQLISDAQKYFQPFLVDRMLAYFDHQTSMSYREVMLYAAAMAASSLIFVVVNNNSFFIGQRAVIMAKSALSCLVYRKVLTLKAKAFHQTSLGQIVNLLSTDIEKFNQMSAIHLLVLQPAETILLLFILSRYFGIVTLMGLVVFGVILTIKLTFGNKFGKLRSVIAQCTDKRIDQMKELLVGIKLVKMFCWESPLSKQIEKIRKMEMKFLGRALRLKAMNFSFDAIGARLIIITLYMGQWILGSPLSEGMYFMALGWLAINTSVWVYTIVTMEETIQCVASIQRIQTFLDLDEEEISTTPQGTDITTFSSSHNESRDQHVALRLCSVVATWIGSSAALSDPSIHQENVRQMSFQIKGVSFKAGRGELVAIAGSVGAGKSSLLLAILGELPLDEGLVCIKGSIGLVTQEPWIFSGTIRENILLGETFDAERYSSVLKATALLHDIEGMPNKDGSVVGERGLMLSGGHKVRVSLARAIYRQFDIYLLDDPLSAVDTEVGKHLFDRCICGYLGGTTRILVTHQLQYLKSVDKIILMKQGQVTDIGTFGDLNEKELEMAQYISRPTEEIGDKAINKRTENETSEADVDGHSALGSSSWTVYKEYLKAGRGWFLIPLFLTFAISSQTLDKKTIHRCKANIPYFSNIAFATVLLSYWRQEKSKRIQNSAVQQSPNTSSDALVALQISVNTSGTAASHGGINSSYGNRSMCDSCMSAHVSADWSQFVFLIFTAGNLLAALLGGQTLTVFFLSSSQRLHDKMFPVVLSSKMRFFDSNPMGIILSRFSRDIGFIDGALPIYLWICLTACISFSVVLVVVCFVNPWMLLPMFPLIGCLMLLRWLSIPTMKGTKRLEASGRSPIFSLLSDTLIGLQTIRSMSIGSQFIKEFDARQNRHSACWFMYVSTHRSFGLYCSAAVAVYMISIIYISIHIGHAIPGVLVGLVLIYIIALSELFEAMMRSLLEVETMMTAVERILTYSNNEPEGDRLSSNPPSADWPTRGNISFKDVCLRYRDTGPFVLSNINFHIKNKEKVGIVGRTGAGKSSILSCLFRLAEPLGAILIDGIDISTIGLHELRLNLSVISQDPVLFEGNLRRNLDLFGNYTDAELYQALTEVQLIDVVERLPGQLYTQISEAGSNFSVGQRQLLCLARTMLRRNKILVLDEATAHVDQETDEIIQETIRRRFSDCTVITIAHRLNTIMDSDRVMVLGDGKILEFDSPYVLLQKPNSIFTHLVEQTGRTTAADLRESAVSAFQMRSRAGMTETLGLDNSFEASRLQSSGTVNVGFDDDTDYITHL